MNPCCDNPVNLVPQDDPRPDVTVRVCRVCGNRHIEVAVDPVRVGVKVE